MSGKSVNIVPWASGSYAAGAFAWSGHSERTAPGFTFFSPEGPVQADIVNNEIGRLTDAILGLQNGGGGFGAALNWPQPELFGGLVIAGAAYDSKWGRWLIFGSSPTVNVFVARSSADGGRTWQNFGGQNPSTGSPTCKLLSAHFDPNGRVAVAAYAGSSPVLPVVDEIVRFNTTSATAYLDGVYFASTYIFAGRDGSTRVLATSTGGAWTDRSASAPSSWTSATACYVAAGPSLVMACASNGDYTYSSNATSWSTSSVPLIGSESVVGLVWGGDRWVCAVTDGTNSRILTSTNGTSWTVAGTLAFYVLGGVGACGTALFATTDAHFIVEGIYSGDGGATWHGGSNYAVHPASANVPDRVWSVNPNFTGSQGYMTTNASHASTSAFR